MRFNLEESPNVFGINPWLSQEFGINRLFQAFWNLSFTFGTGLHLDRLRWHCSIIHSGYVESESFRRDRAFAHQRNDFFRRYAAVRGHSDIHSEYRGRMEGERWLDHK